jgi:hypothetical protein
LGEYDGSPSKFALVASTLSFGSSNEAKEPSLYAVAYRTTKDENGWHLDLWQETLTLGASLPTLPLWLASNLSVPLELKATYEETCQVLRIR